MGFPSFLSSVAHELHKILLLGDGEWSLQCKGGIGENWKFSQSVS